MEGLRHESSFLVSFGALCQQGMCLKIKWSSTRCIFICLFLMNMIVCYFYTSKLVSTLVEIKPETNIENIEDLANSDLPIGISDATITRTYLNVNDFNRNI